MAMEVSSCRVCLTAHDDAIHAATLRVRQWFREQVTYGLDADEKDDDAPAKGPQAARLIKTGKVA